MTEPTKAADSSTTEPVPQRRGSGRTTEQMRNAPKGAIFVWCMGRADWAKQRAIDLGRHDLVVIGSDDLRENRVDRLRGKNYPALIIDHTLRDAGLDPQQWAGYNLLMSHVGRTSS